MYLFIELSGMPDTNLAVDRFEEVLKVTADAGIEDCIEALEFV
jgi:hypothetical protein